MARLIKKLTALSVKKINKAGDYSDGAGFWLRVSHAGAKSWMFRFSFEKKNIK
ncbi:Arm DNA-binding domain-containing protein [Gilliamella apicola]|uniref:Arm DNA-binding domain-containing protein n=1 Tax=Gilliamella apicola TaxID=1196095 RepID=UPI002FEDF49A